MPPSFPKRRPVRPRAPIRNFLTNSASQRPSSQTHSANTQQRPSTVRQRSRSQPQSTHSPISASSPPGPTSSPQIASHSTFKSRSTQSSNSYGFQEGFFDDFIHPDADERDLEQSQPQYIEENENQLGEYREPPVLRSSSSSSSQASSVHTVIYNPLPNTQIHDPSVSSNSGSISGFPSNQQASAQSLLVPHDQIPKKLYYISPGQSLRHGIHPPSPPPLSFPQTIDEMIDHVSTHYQDPSESHFIRLYLSFSAAANYLFHLQASDEKRGIKRELKLFEIFGEIITAEGKRVVDVRKVVRCGIEADRDEEELLQEGDILVWGGIGGDGVNGRIRSSEVRERLNDEEEEENQFEFESQSSAAVSLRSETPGSERGRGLYSSNSVFSENEFEDENLSERRTESERETDDDSEDLSIRERDRASRVRRSCTPHPKNCRKNTAPSEASENSQRSESSYASIIHAVVNSSRLSPSASPSAHSDSSADTPLVPTHPSKRPRPLPHQPIHPLLNICKARSSKPQKEKARTRTNPQSNKITKYLRPTNQSRNKNTKTGIAKAIEDGRISTAARSIRQRLLHEKAQKEAQKAAEEKRRQEQEHLLLRLSAKKNHWLLGPSNPPPGCSGWKIHKILDSKIIIDLETNQQTKEYLIKWADSSFENSWEPWFMIDPRAVSKFLRRRKRWERKGRIGGEERIKVGRRGRWKLERERTGWMKGTRRWGGRWEEVFGGGGR